MMQNLCGGSVRAVRHSRHSVGSWYSSLGAVRGVLTAPVGGVRGVGRRRVRRSVVSPAAARAVDRGEEHLHVLGRDGARAAGLHSGHASCRASLRVVPGAVGGQRLGALATHRRKAHRLTRHRRRCGGGSASDCNTGDPARRSAGGQEPSPGRSVGRTPARRTGVGKTGRERPKPDRRPPRMLVGAEALLAL